MWFLHDHVLSDLKLHHDEVSAHVKKMAGRYKRELNEARKAKERDSGSGCRTKDKFVSAIKGLV